MAVQAIHELDVVFRYDVELHWHEVAEAKLNVVIHPVQVVGLEHVLQYDIEVEHPTHEPLDRY